MDDVFGSRRAELGPTLASLQVDSVDSYSWLDLSTTTPPWSWSVTHVPEQIWRNTADLDTLTQKACEFYGADNTCCVPTSGIQQSIQLLPKLVDTVNIAVPVLGYDEHAYHWQQHGHQLHPYKSFKELVALVSKGTVTAAVIINPNNPSGVKVPIAFIKELQATPTLELLIIDEALVELSPELTMLPHCQHHNTIVLRSLSKFYGLAGMRLGFAFGGHPVLAQLKQVLGPWAVSNVAAHAACQLFEDTSFHERQRARVEGACRQLLAHLSEALPHAKLLEGGLFVTALGPVPMLESFYQRAREQNILLTLGYVDAKKAWLRVGIAKHYLHFKELCQQFSEHAQLD